MRNPGHERFRGRLRNPKHERFAVEVASMVPVARAYVLAGYPDTEFARPNGSRLAHEPKVAARIQELRDEFSKNAALSVEYLQALLLQVATANVLDFFKNENGKLVPKPLSELDHDQGAAVAAIKVGEPSTLELKFYNKIDAINVLLKSIGAITEKHDHTVRSPDDARYTDIELARWIAARLEEGASTAQELIPPRSDCPGPQHRAPVNGGPRERE
jgi:hypothetical protein